MDTLNGTTLNAQPKKWIALVLGFFLNPLAFLYVGAPRLAAASLGAGLVIGLTGYFLPGLMPGYASSLISLAFGVGCAILAYRLAAKKSSDAPRPGYSRWYGLLGAAGVTTAVVLVLRVFLYEPYRAPSSAMMPTIPTGSNLLVQKWGYGHYSTMGMVFGSGRISAPLERGDLIVFDYPRDPSQTYIKRLVGLPGDKLVYRDKHVLVNGVDVRGKQLDEYLDAERLRYFQRYQERQGNILHDILINPDASAWGGTAEHTLPPQCTIDHEVMSCDIPAGNYFVMGDNRDNSMDSRYWGFVSAKAILGKVVHISVR
jgi:signal peptidase I